MNINEHPMNQNLEPSSEEVDDTDLGHAVPVPQSNVAPHAPSVEPFTANIGHNS